MQNDEWKKEDALRARGTFNTRAGRISDTLFGKGGFFDVRDLVQVKCEMLRRVREDGMSVAQAAARRYARLPLIGIGPEFTKGFQPRRGPAIVALDHVCPSPATHRAQEKPASPKVERARPTILSSHVSRLEGVARRPSDCTAGHRRTVA